MPASEKPAQKRTNGKRGDDQARTASKITVISSADH